MKRRVLITGANGGIGSALCKEFECGSWEVLATDVDSAPRVEVSRYLELDLDQFCNDENYRLQRLDILAEALQNGLDCLVNNAAYQHVAAIESLEPEEWQKTLNTNVTAPFLLVKELLAYLRKRKGSVINITSVHSKLTKPGFSAYSVSKSALEGLTRALAVELGGTIRINAISPAAIETPMLVSGFEGNAEGLEELASFHPSGRLGRPEDVAALAFFLAQSPSGFLNGTVIGLDGGVAARLHDPA